MLLEPVVGSGGGYEPRVGIDLIGTKNGSNPVFSTPDKFIQNAQQKIAPYWNSRRLKEGRDFTVHESGGAGTGYDELRLTPWGTAGFLPRATDELVADYYIDPNV